MRLLACLFLLPSLAFGQELHTFENGQVADAQKINENFNYVLENASGGCTVEQVDNSAVISCADGTSAVIAGAGTAVLLPEGTVGETPDIEGISVGDFYYEDGNGVLLSRYYEGFTGHPNGVSTTLVDLATDTGMRVHQVDETQTLYLVEGGGGNNSLLC